MDINEEIVKMFDVAADDEFTDLLVAVERFVAKVIGSDLVEFIAQWQMPCREVLFLQVKSDEKPVCVDFDTTDKSYFVNWTIGEESGYLYYGKERFMLPAFAVSAIETAIKINVESITRKVEWGEEAAIRVLGITYHDFRNIFGSITGVMQLLEMDERENKKISDSFAGIKDVFTAFDEPNKERIMLLRNEPLTYKNKMVDISSLYNAILTKNQKVYNYSQIDLEYKIEENIKTNGDEQKISLILGELLVNASDSFEDVYAGGKIKVNVFVENGNCVVSVEDSGAGMDYDLQRYITKKFFTRKFKRSGLGLTCVRRTIEDWGGELRFTSAPEKGTLMRACFPIVL